MRSGGGLGGNNVEKEGDKKKGGGESAGLEGNISGRRICDMIVRRSKKMITVGRR